MIKALLKIVKGIVGVLTAPIRWLVKAPFRLLFGILLLLALLVVLVPNLVMVLGQRGNLRTAGELANEIAYPLEDISAGQEPSGLGPSGTYECIMVLGAGVRPDGTPSPMLQERLDRGIELYFAGVAPKIVMSGDNQSDRETYNEVENMRRYAIEQGVPSEDIFCDHAGICTYDSAYRLYHVFSVKHAVVISQEYHLSRALFDCASFGIEAVGVPADREEYPVKMIYRLREVAARVSDMGKVLSRQNATYLSEPVSLDQSGDVTSWEY